MKKFVLFTICALSAFSASAAEPATNELVLTIKDHVFSPEKLEVPAGQKVTITIDNQDATPEEFESKALHREKIIKGNSKATVIIGPLKAGEYKYFGEYNEKTAHGMIVAK